MGRPGAAGRVGRGPGETAPGKGNLPGRRFSGNVGWSVIIIDDNYNLTTTANHKGTKAQRTLKKIRDGPPALRSVRAAGQPLDGDSRAREAGRAKIISSREGAKSKHKSYSAFAVLDLMSIVSN